LAELARRAADVLASATDDPDLPPLTPPAPMPGVAGFDEETAELGAGEQSKLAAAAIGASNGFPLYGYFTSGVVEEAIASTTGLRATQRATDSTCLALAAADGASGYAIGTSWRVGELEPAAVAEEAAAKAARTRDAAVAEPARYRAVLEPYALAERSFFAGRIGERAFAPKVTLVDEPLDAGGLPRSFDYEGTPKRRVPLVEDGVLRGVAWDRATAARAGVESTGHALPAGERSFGAVPTAVRLAPGEAESVDELAELVGDGVYIT